MQEDINGVAVRRLRHFIPQNPTALARLHMELSFGIRLLLAKWGEPDVVILVSPALFSTALATFRAKLGLRRPVVVTWVQDLYSRGVVEASGASGLASSLATALEGFILRSSHQVVAIHDRFREHILKHFRIGSSRVSVIRNWTHLPQAPATGQSEFRSSRGWANDDFVVLHCGNMGMKQGLENVVRAAQLAEKNNSEVRFVLMGNGHQRRKLEAMSRGIAKLDFVDPLPDLEFQMALTAADALLVNELPGVRDMSVPSKLTSYFNAGVPIVCATDSGSVTSSELEASQAGVRVEAADPQGLLEALEALAGDKELADSLGLRGMAYRNQTLSEATAISKYDDLVQDLVKSRNKNRCG